MVVTDDVDSSCSGYEYTCNCRGGWLWIKVVALVEEVGCR